MDGYYLFLLLLFIFFLTGLYHFSQHRYESFFAKLYVRFHSKTIALLKEKDAVFHQQVLRLTLTFWFCIFLQAGFFGILISRYHWFIYSDVTPFLILFIPWLFRCIADFLLNRLVTLYEEGAE